MNWLIFVTYKSTKEDIEGYDFLLSVFRLGTTVKHKQIGDDFSQP